MAFLPSLIAVGGKVTAALVNQLISTTPITDSGVQSVTAAAAGTSYTQVVAFASSTRFTATPVVVLQTTSQTVTGLSVSNVTTAGFTINFVMSSAATRNINWIAAQTP